MDNSNMSKNRQNEYLGVNKLGKNIRKSPLHQPSFTNTGPNNNNNNNNNGVLGSSPARQQPQQPQVYNISKNDFRSIVQQLTGSPSQNDPLPRPPNNPPKPPSMRLQRIRPPPLSPINRPPMPPVVVTSTQAPLLPRPHGPPMVPHQPHFNNFARPPPPPPPPPHHFGQLPSPRGMNMNMNNPLTPALSPISAYMRQLQNCIGEDGPRPGPQPQGQGQGQGPPQGNQYMPPQGNQYMPAQPPILQHGPPGVGPGQPPMQPQAPAHGSGQHHPMHLQSPTTGLLPNPNMPPLPSPGSYGTGLLPSPTSQFLLPSPTSGGGYFNLLSPTQRSPYPLLSPGSQFPPPLSPNFAFSPFGQYGILGSGPQPPLSPGISFPSSPSGFFPMTSPRWRDQ